MTLIVLIVMLAVVVSSEKVSYAKIFSVGVVVVVMLLWSWQSPLQRCGGGGGGGDYRQSR